MNVDVVHFIDVYIVVDGEGCGLGRARRRRLGSCSPLSSLWGAEEAEGPP